MPRRETRPGKPREGGPVLDSELRGGFFLEAAFEQKPE